jgi:hypothetical protein
VSKREDIDLLTKRVAELEQQVARLSDQLGHADSVRLTELAEEASRLNAATEAGLRTLRERAAPLGVGGPRFDIKLNTVYRAEADGHVSVTFVGGFTGRVQILAGRTNPPAEPVSFPGDEYVSGLIRRGEYWTVATVPPGRKPAFRGIFTPLY